jgi:type IV pilus assembly protein PilN
MIRINLLEQPRPKATRKAVPLGATLPSILILAAVGFAFLVLAANYVQMGKDLAKENDRIKLLRAQKTDLERIKQEVEAFEGEKKLLQQQISVIEQLQRDRAGGQELLDTVANTVSRTENLWLTSMVRKGNSLSVDGAAASINSVANFITQLKRSGYFQRIEIKETKQDDKNLAVQTFVFQMTAEIAPPQPVKPAAASAPASARPAPAPAKKG